MNAPAQPRLAVVLSHPTQYYSPWFRWIAAEGTLNLRVFYLWDFGVTTQIDPRFGTAFSWDVDLLTGYAHEFVPNRSSEPGTETFGGLDNPTLPARVAAWRPDAVLIFGYRFRTHLRFIVWASLRRIPLIFRGDSHLIAQPRPGLGKRLFLGALYRRFAAVTFVGQSNRDYFQAFGVPARRLHFAPHAVNADHFDRFNDRTRKEAQALRRTLGLAPNTRVVLFAGKFVAAKQPRELLRAFMAVKAPDAALVFVGDGAEKMALMEEAAAAQPGTVHFLPFANQTEIPVRYLLADLFVLPSRGLYETWGLAINEAMHMGVPCLVSDRVGCHRDLVTDGQTGWVFKVDQPRAMEEKLAAALAQLATSRESIKAAVAARISAYTYTQTTAGLVSAVHAVLGHAR